MEETRVHQAPATALSRRCMHVSPRLKLPIIPGYLVPFKSSENPSSEQSQGSPPGATPREQDLREGPLGPGDQALLIADSWAQTGCDTAIPGATAPPGQRPSRPLPHTKSAIQ